MLKKFTSFILAVMIIISCSVISSAEVSLPMKFTVKGKNGSRPADSIVFYNQQGTTGTNIYGYEVSVDKDGKIFSLGGNNSVVPEDGFVLSGHGTGAEFLKENAAIGLYASFCPLTYEVTFDTVPSLPFGSKSVEPTVVNSYRSTDYLVVYTPEYKSPTTCTNKWGNEAVVENGIITSIGGNNNEIPKNGFVISAVGSALGWFYNTLSVGLSATYDKETNRLTVSYDVNSVIYSDNNKLANLKDKLSTAHNHEQAVSLYNSAEKMLNDAVCKLSADNNQFDYLSFSRSFSHVIDSAASTCYTTCNKEVRGVWCNAKEKSKEEVETVVEQMYQLGFNSISVCGMDNGCFLTTLPSDNPFTSTVSLGKEDIIRYYAEACHERNMKLSLWMPVFNVGYTSSANVVTKKLPSLQVLSQNNKPECVNGFVFLDPSNEYATNLLLKTYKYILENYDIDTFELDYIRYFGSQDGLDFGYFTAAQDDFVKKYGEIPVFDKSWHLWNEWCLVRAAYITDFVKQTHEMIKTTKPDTLLAADVFGEDTAKYAVYQDWQTWIDNEYIDMVVPMLYGVNTFNDSIDVFADAVKGKDVMLVPGLGTLREEVTPEVLAEQIETSRQRSACGINLFSLPTSFKCENPRIKDGVFKEKAKYPVEFYTVTFTDVNSDVISTKTVINGRSAESPEIKSDNPHAEFVRWDKDVTAVESDMTVSPVYTYSECSDNDNDGLCDICGMEVRHGAEEPVNGILSLIKRIINIIKKIIQFFNSCFNT